MLIIILVFGREMKETHKKYIIEKNYCQFSRIVKPIVRNKCVERQKN